MHGDIAALPDGLGEFDFIIAHGVYSWVPDFVRAALLTACRKLLRPQGIAYVSFNVEAGWRIYGQIRQILLQQDKPGLSPVQRVEQARSVLAGTAFDGEHLRKEADYLRRASASYLFHEYLSDINNAHSFGRFVVDAAGHGLRYLGEAGPRRARVALENDRGLSAEARYERWLEAEAGLDDAFDTRFRRALLVRDDACLPQPQHVAQLEALAFSASLTSDDELDFAESGNQHFTTGAGERLPVSHPLLKAFLVVLSSVYPQALAYADAAGHALALAREYGYRGEAGEAFNEALLDFTQMHGLCLHTCVPARPAVSTGFPQASALTRAQTASPDWPVTNAFHSALDMDEWGRRLLAAMDGSASVEALERLLLEGLGQAGIQATPQQAAQHVQSYLEFFQRQGLIN